MMLKWYSKWRIYSASYLPLYFILIARVLFGKGNNSSEQSIVLQNWNQNWIVIIIMIVLIILSIVTIYMLRNVKPTERTFVRIKENKTIEMSSFVLPYVASIIAISLDWYGWLILGVVYIALGIIMIMSDMLRLSPAFLLAGYRLYINDDNMYILARKKKASINIQLDESIEGIEIKPLTEKLSIMIISVDK